MIAPGHLRAQTEAAPDIVADALAEAGATTDDVVVEIEAVAEVG